MKSQYIMEFIGRIFNDLSSSQKVDMVATLYCDLSDAEKDEFLRQTGNA